MDRFDVLVARAHRRLKLRRLLMAIERNPRLLEKMQMDKRPPLTIPRPVELAGMRSRLLRAQQQQKDIAAIGVDYDAVMDGIDEAKSALKGHVGDLKTYEASVRSTIESMLDRSNGGDPLDSGEETGQSGQTSQSGTGTVAEKQVVDVADVGTIEGIVALAAGAAPQPAAPPEQLSVHGVSQG